MSECPLVWIIMGVAGAGKTVVGRVLSERLDSDFLEGDRRHSVRNIIKMASQRPLQDQDRLEWLLEIENDVRRAIERNIETVLTCSALKASYRRQLSSPGRVQPVWIDVPISELERRLTRRENHYMRPEMLNGPIAAFEPVSPNENVITVDGSLQPDDVVDELLAKAIKLFPGLRKSWWQRSIE